jgi:hypothetical protein
VASKQVSDLVPEEATITVPFGAESVIVTCRPRVYTPTFIAEHASASAVDVLPELLTGWDVLDDAGVAVPVTREGLAGVPFPVLNRVFNVVLASIRSGNFRAAA